MKLYTLLLLSLIAVSCKPTIHEQLMDAYDKHHCAFQCLMSTNNPNDRQRWKDSMDKYGRIADSLVKIKYPEEFPKEEPTCNCN